MNKYTYLKIFSLIFFLSATASFAQNTDPSIGKKIQNIKNIFAERDPIKNEVDMYQRTISGIDEQTAEILQKLRNPFTPQLPLEPPDDKSNQIDLPEDQFTEGPKQPEIETPMPEFNISGLVWNSDRPQAIINDQVMTVGDVIESWTITNIQKEGVEINFQGQTFLIEP